MAEPPTSDPTDDTDLAEAEEAALREAAEFTDGHESGDPSGVVPAATPRSSGAAAAAPKPRKAATKVPADGSARARRAAPRAGSGTAAPATPPSDRQATTLQPSEVRPESVLVSQGGIGFANATTVDVRQGGIGRVEAKDVAVSMGGIGIARGERVSVEMGGVGAVFADEARVSQGLANAVVAREAHVEQSLVQTVLAERVVFQRPSGVFLLVARRVEGNVRTLFDWRGAIAFGATFAVIASLLRRLR
jgi:hypothetical protein